MKVEKSYYLGNLFGNSSEADMMKEIRSRGPIVGDMLVPHYVSYYSEGIFSESHIDSLQA